MAGSTALFTAAGSVAGTIQANAEEIEAYLGGVATEMGKLGNKIRSLLTGILIGKGGGMSEEQELVRRGGAKPATELTEEERRRKEAEKKGESGDPPDPPQDL